LEKYYLDYFRKEKNKSCEGDSKNS
jgi:hypothetical protein